MIFPANLLWQDRQSSMAGPFISKEEATVTSIAETKNPSRALWRNPFAASSVGDYGAELTAIRA